MMTKHALGAAALVALLALPALAQTIPAMKTSASEGEKATATYFTEDSVGDVQLGRLGQQRARNAAVRMLAAAMVRDHTRTANAGLQVAQAIGDDEAQLKAGDDNQIALSHLARYSGAKFDREFVSAHDRRAQSRHQRGQGRARVRHHARAADLSDDTIAIDTHHLRMALAAQQQVGKGE